MGKGFSDLNSILVRRFTLLAKWAAGCFTLICVSLASAAGPGWASTFEQAVEQARKQQKPIFVDFSTSWCGICKIMDSTVLSEPGIIARLDNFVKVKVDGDVRADLCNQFGVKAYPTFIHIDPSGRILEKREGQMRSREMASALDKTMQAVASTRQVQQPRAVAQAAPSQQPNSTAVSHGNSLLSAPTEETKNRREVASNNRTDSRSRPVAEEKESAEKNAPDASLGDSVYALNQNPRAENRSRFGGSSSSLKELAQATAEPAKAKEEVSKMEKTKSSDKEEKSEKSDERKPTEVAKAKAKDSEKEETARKSPETKTEAKQELTLRAPVETAKTDLKPSPVVETTLAGLTDSELPKPMLNRNIVNASQTMNPPATITATSNENKDVLSVIHKLQGNTAPASPKGPETVKAEVPKAESKEVVQKQVVLEKPTEKIVANLAPSRTVDSSVKTEEKAEAKGEEKKPGEKKADAPTEAKTETGATKSDLERWMKDADTKLVDGRKKEARAMYSKVVENDPKNISAKTDMAFIKMVSLIVDKDSDLQRREAYNKIREFEARYPDSLNKDYYTLIRAILATDLGETNEAHRLLGTYPDRFPKSKYLQMAHKTWKELPPLKKESSSTTAKSGSGSSSNSGNSSKSSTSSKKSSKS